MENCFPVRAAEKRVAGAFGVGHESENIAGFVADAGDVLPRAVGVGRIGDLALRVGVTKQNLPVDLQAVEGFVVGEIAAFAVRDGDVQQRAGPSGVGKGGVVVFDPHGDVLADEMESAVAHERPGQKAGFTKDLKAIANADHDSPRGGKVLHRAHDGREAGDGSAAQIIPVGKSPRHDHRVETGERGILVPDVIGGGTGQGIEDMDAVLVAIGPGEADDGEFHKMETTNGH